MKWQNGKEGFQRFARGKSILCLHKLSKIAHVVVKLNKELASWLHAIDGDEFLAVNV